MIGYPLKSQDEEKRKLNGHVIRLQAANEAHKAARKSLEDEIRELKKKVGELERKLSQSEEEKEKLRRQRDKYRNMIFKPNKKSTDEAEPEKDTPLEEFPKKKKKKRGRKKGHDGAGRKKPDWIDWRKRVYLKQCPICASMVKRSNQINEHIVEDIPSPEKTKTEVTKYEVEEQWCSKCKKRVRAKPFGVIPKSKLGIYLLTFVMVQKYGAKSSWDSIIFILSTYFNVKVSKGGLVNILHRARDWLGPYYHKILEEIRMSPVKYADETSWRVDGINKWLWGFFTEQQAYYVVEESRGKGVAEENLNVSHEDDVLVRDDYNAYKKLPFNHQSCWSHLLRVSHETACDEKASAEVKKLHIRSTKMFEQLDKLLKIPFRQEHREQCYQLYKRKINKIINTHYKEKDTKMIQTRITNQSTNLITALLYRNVPLTNNLSERCLRPFVIARKISGGSRSDAGAKTQAVNMSIFQTIKMQNLPIIPTLKDYLLSGSRKN